MESKPAAIAETDEKIGWNKTASLRVNGHQVPWQLRSLIQKLWTKTIKWEPSRTERIPRCFSKNPRCWTTNLVKKKNHQWSDANRAGHRKIYGRRSRLTTNPKGCAGRRKTNDVDRLINALTSDNKFTSAWPWMDLIKFYKNNLYRTYILTIKSLYLE